MSGRVLKSVWRRVGPRGAAAGAALAGALLLLLLLSGQPQPAPPLSARFPGVAAPRLAHLLADFSTHARLHAALGEWSVEEESGNYTAWRYSVRYTCGARCAGAARVLARDEHAAGSPQHAAPRAHTVLAAHRECRTLPLLPWPEFCDEWETESTVRADGAGGAQLSERARARCAVGGSRCAAELLARRRRLLQHLRDQLLPAHTSA